MRRMINAAFAYAAAAMAGGVFSREYTKLTDFTGQTSLSVVHTHLFLLGMLFLLVAALMERALGHPDAGATSTWMSRRSSSGPLTLPR